MAEDIELLRQYAETRANEAFAALVDRYIALVYSAALRQLGGAVHRAEDVTQTVFVHLARQAAENGSHATRPTWMRFARSQGKRKRNRPFPGPEARRLLSLNFGNQSLGHQNGSQNEDQHASPRSSVFPAAIDGASDRTGAMVEKGWNPTTTTALPVRRVAVAGGGKAPAAF